MSCTSLGVATVNLYAPYVATNYGWQNAFLLTALLPVLIFILSYFTVRKPSAEILAQREAEAHVEAVPVGEKPSIKENLIHVLKNRNIRCLAFAGFFATGATWAVAQWSNLYMVKQLGVNAIYAGHVMSAFGLAALIAKPTIGILSDILPIKKNHLTALVMFLFGPALILFASTTNPDMLFITGSNSWYWRIHAQCVDECSRCTISRTSLARYYGRLCKLIQSNRRYVGAYDFR